MIEYLDTLLNKLIKRFKDKQFRKKVLAYKEKLNEKKESWETK